MLSVRTLLAATFLTALTGAAFAQTVPTSVDAGRIGNELDKAYRAAPVSIPADLTNAPDVQAPKGSDKITLVLRQVKIEGATALSQDQIAVTYKDLIGKKITLTQVYAIANAITKLYRDSGYILSRAVVPQQEIDGGIVTIQVVEGKVSGFNIQGETYGAKEQLAAYARKLQGTGAVTSRNLERYLLLMNDLPGVKVRAVLSPSKTVVGGANLTLVTEQRRVQGAATLDNFGNRFIGPERVTLSGQLNSLFKSTDQLNAAILLTPSHDELRYFSGSYKQNIGTEGTKLGLNASYTETDPSLPAALGGNLEPEGRATSVGLFAEHPFVRLRALNVIGRGAFDVNQNKTNYGPGLSAIETKDDQRIMRAGGTVTYLDKLSGYNTFDATLSKGIQAFGASDKGDANLSRAAGDPAFTKIGGEVTRLQQLSGPFTGLIGVSGQFAFNPLLASEEYGLGGSEYGRGYDSSEVTGDSGVASKIELAYNGKVEQRYLNDYQLYSFYDIGAVWDRDPAAGESVRRSTSSVGVGTRLGITDTVRGDMFVAKPLTRDILSRGSSGDDLRFRFAVTTNF